MKVACTSSFLKGIKKLKKSHQEDIIIDINDTLEKLLKFEITTQKDNHTLTNAKGLRDLHIRPNIILLYRYEENLVTLGLKLIADDITDHDKLANSLSNSKIADKKYDTVTSKKVKESYSYGVGIKKSIYKRLNKNVIK